MAGKRRLFQDNEAIEGQVLDQALGRNDGHVVVSLPNAPAALEAQSKADRLDHVFGLGGRQGRRKFTRGGALGQGRFITR